MSTHKRKLAAVMFTDIVQRFFKDPKIAYAV